ncbi:MAG: PEGA domain-containing protein [Deltaproteobacteria bacterium]|nr:PEGA domain-containing protein [Deltaproteobacteria bacterium]
MPALLLVGLLLVGCAHRTRIASEPSGAGVQVGRRVIGSTPVEIVVWSVPFTHPSATVTLAGYRPSVIDLRADRRPARRAWEFLTFRWKQAFAREPGQAHEVLLVPRHGPVGTWTEEDIPG